MPVLKLMRKLLVHQNLLSNSLFSTSFIYGTIMILIIEYFIVKRSFAGHGIVPIL